MSTRIVRLPRFASISARLLSVPLSGVAADAGPSSPRSAYRYAEAESFRNYQVGFRVTRELKD